MGSEKESFLLKIYLEIRIKLNLVMNFYIVCHELQFTFDLLTLCRISIVRVFLNAVEHQRRYKSSCREFIIDFCFDMVVMSFRSLG